MAWSRSVAGLTSLLPNLFYKELQRNQNNILCVTSNILSDQKTWLSHCCTFMIHCRHVWGWFPLRGFQSSQRPAWWFRWDITSDHWDGMYQAQISLRLSLREEEGSVVRVTVTRLDSTWRWDGERLELIICNSWNICEQYQLMSREWPLSDSAWTPSSFAFSDCNLCFKSNFTQNKNIYSNCLWILSKLVTSPSEFLSRPPHVNHKREPRSGERLWESMVRPV